VIEAQRPVQLLVLGLGNVLCGDDGLGAAAIALLDRRFIAPEGVQVLDGGTLGLSLIPWIEDSAATILVDAIRDDAAPGSLVRLEGDEVGPAVEARLSVHQVGVADVFAGLQLLGRVPPHLVLWGLVPQTLELGLGRSAIIEERLPELVDRVVGEARRLGHAFTPRLHDEASSPVSARDVVRVLGL
jgi:hydrogenase maturation protease